MSSSPSNNMEEDAWLMKIELKREEPMDAVKGDKGKEATGEQAPVAEQAWPVEEEEEDILKPYYEHLTRTMIEAFRIIETARVQNKYLTRENILLQEHIIALRSVIRRLENLLLLKDKIASSPPPSYSSPPKENWVSGMGTPLGFRQAWGRCHGIVSSHYLLALLILVRYFALDE
jgi:hypothetical protein